MSSEHYDLVVIGSGPAGQKGAIAAAKRRKKVAVVDRSEMIGGRLPVTTTGAEGVLTTTVDLANPPEPSGLIMAGSTYFFQAWYRDPTGGLVGFNLSDGYMIAFVP